LLARKQFFEFIYRDYDKICFLARIHRNILRNFSFIAEEVVHSVLAGITDKYEDHAKNNPILLSLKNRLDNERFAVDYSEYSESRLWILFVNNDGDILWAF
jgi:hypothetical protein